MYDGHVMVRGCLLGWKFVCVCIRSSLHSVHFGQLLRCASKRIVNIMKSVHRKEQHKQFEQYRYTRFSIGALLLTLFVQSAYKLGIHCAILGFS